MKKKLRWNNQVIRQNEKVEKRAKIWNIKLMRQTLIKIEAAIAAEVDIVKT